MTLGKKPIVSIRNHDFLGQCPVLQGDTGNVRCRNKSSWDKKRDSRSQDNTSPDKIRGLREEILDDIDGFKKKKIAVDWNTLEEDIATMMRYCLCKGHEKEQGMIEKAQVATMQHLQEECGILRQRKGVVAGPSVGSTTSSANTYGTLAVSPPLPPPSFPLASHASGLNTPPSTPAPVTPTTSRRSFYGTGPSFPCQGNTHFTPPPPSNTAAPNTFIHNGQGDVGTNNGSYYHSMQPGPSPLHEAGKHHAPSPPSGVFSPPEPLPLDRHDNASNCYTLYHELKTYVDHQQTGIAKLEQQILDLRAVNANLQEVAETRADHQEATIVALKQENLDLNAEKAKLFVVDRALTSRLEAEVATLKQQNRDWLAGHDSLKDVVDARLAEFDANLREASSMKPRGSTSNQKASSLAATSTKPQKESISFHVRTPSDESLRADQQDEEKTILGNLSLSLLAQNASLKAENEKLKDRPSRTIGSTTSAIRKLKTPQIPSSSRPKTVPSGSGVRTRRMTKAASNALSAEQSTLEFKVVGRGDHGSNYNSTSALRTSSVEARSFKNFYSDTVLQEGAEKLSSKLKGFDGRGEQIDSDFDDIS